MLNEKIQQIWTLKLYHQSLAKFKFLTDKAGRRLVWEDDFALKETLSQMKTNWEDDSAHYSIVSVDRMLNDRIIFHNTDPFEPNRETSIILKLQGYGKSCTGGFSTFAQEEEYAKIIAVE
jgi:hypothetical protein